MKPRGRGGAADPKATRSALLEAGTQVFAERGFKGATAELIARRARANKAMINYHFGSKKGLYQAILTAVFGEMALRLRSVRSADRPAPEQLKQFVALFADLAATHPAFPTMLLRELVSGGEHMGREEAGSMLAVYGLVREIVEQGMREGTVRKVDPTLTHVSLVGSLCFFFATESFRRRAFADAKHLVLPRAEDFVVHVQELITRGLAPEPARPRRTR